MDMFRYNKRARNYTPLVRVIKEGNLTIGIRVHTGNGELLWQTERDAKLDRGYGYVKFCYYPVLAKRMLEAGERKHDNF